MASTITSQKQIPAMPEGLNPDTLDTLTELAVLLNRLRQPRTGATPTAPTPPNPPLQPTSQLQSSQRPTQAQAQTNNGATTTTNTGELSLKEISPAADVLKHRFQRARTLVLALPDMGRGIAEQEVEMSALEQKLARQRDMLARLREMGGRLTAVVTEEGGGDKMVLD
ncbi:RNA polymerase II transcription mediator complex subunit 9-domain-containing protein [Hypoxylon sp. NC1633]|nr:RNA polymerase II transcription mediator complex subunit 9-domain-containing protein [Hypoxylon sp. NC1633]